MSPKQKRKRSRQYRQPVDWSRNAPDLNEEVFAMDEPWEDPDDPENATAMDWWMGTDCWWRDD